MRIDVRGIAKYDRARQFAGYHGDVRSGFDAAAFSQNRA